MRVSIIAATGALLFLGVLGLALGVPAFSLPDTTSLGAESFRASMQGQSGVSLDLDADGHDDLLVGAPYARNRDGRGAVLVYRGTPSAFPAAPDAVLRG
jgi:hypothetical protein